MGQFFFSMGLAAVLVFSSTVFANQEVNQDTARMRRCHNEQVDALNVILVENQMRFKRAQRGGAARELFSRDTIQIAVAFHGISDGSAGVIDEKRAQEQVDVLNRAYAPLNVEFVLVSFEQTNNAKWYRAGYGEKYEKEMKKTLHQGSADTLNVYTSAPTDGSLGWAAFPWDYSTQPKMDGIVIHFETLPGGSFKEYNMGNTLVHEAGHWLGLFHTFQGGCLGGDQVDDTPAEGGPSFGCPEVAKDSCTSDSELDPIHNYMDYSDDVCLTEFSHGQAERIHDSFESYRLGQ